MKTPSSSVATAGNTPAFTPGPWTVSDQNFVYVGGDPVYVPLTDENGKVRQHRTGLIALPYSTANGGLEANARLIAAAPELLEALKQFVSNEQSEIEWHVTQANRNGSKLTAATQAKVDALDAARAAIAKAEGRA